MKTWKPDTCGCLVEEIYSGSEIVGGGRVLEKCPVHQSVADADLYGVLYSNVDGENKRKNQILRILLGYEGLDFGLQEMKKQDGKDAGFGLKDGIEYAWSFDGVGSNRVLRVEVKGSNLTQTQKDSIKVLCDTKFGSGKVEIA